MQLGVNMAQLARENNIYDNLQFNWRRHYQQELLPARTDVSLMLPVMLAAESGPEPTHPRPILSDDVPYCKLDLPPGRFVSVES